MANRMTTYGYGYIDGKLSVIESEAEIVRRVFKEYCNGAILSEIGQSLTREGVEYYMGCTQWNKNRIKRIIENEKYIGADGYPQIVDEDEFVYANKLKDNRGRPQAIRHSSEVETARDIVYCGQCGRIMGRRSKWRSRENGFVQTVASRTFILRMQRFSVACSMFLIRSTLIPNC